ncbi:MAG: FHIPEP family type III secretion protein [Candidatus Bruticola sp.]
MPLPQINETKNEIKLFSLANYTADFIPWKRSERGQQVYIKVTRDQEDAFLYVGENCVLDAELQQALIRLVNEGWNVAGELTMSFEGSAEPGIDPYVYQDPVVLELGKGLLPLLDPQQSAPLVSAMPGLRDEIARESGLVPAGVRIKDNLRLEPCRYNILLHNSPIASGEIYLDRFLAIGSFEQLSTLEGWAAVEPTYRMKAKWIEANLRDKAEQVGCLLVGPLQVLLTHLKSIMLESAPELLGLQDTFNLISRLQITHPIVVNEFLKDNLKLRILRRVLQSLLRERIALNNMVTILETIGDGLIVQIDLREAVIEHLAENCRLSLARQICWSNLTPNGELQAAITGDKLEADLHKLKQLQHSEKKDEAAKLLTDRIITCVKDKLQAAGNPNVIITAPELRRFFSNLIQSDIPHMCVLSTREVEKSRVKMIINGTLEYKKDDQISPVDENEHKSETGELEENKAIPVKNEESNPSSSEGILSSIFKKPSKKK